MSKATPPERWVGLAGVTNLLRCGRRRALAAVEAGKVRRRRLPGTARTEYSRSDVERLAREAVVIG